MNADETTVITPDDIHFSLPIIINLFHILSLPIRSPLTCVGGFAGGAVPPSDGTRGRSVEGNMDGTHATEMRSESNRDSPPTPQLIMAVACVMR